MEISKKTMRTALAEVLEEELPDHTDKARASIVDALLDRIEVDFEVLDDEDDEDPDADGDELDFD